MKIESFDFLTNPVITISQSINIFDKINYDQ